MSSQDLNQQADEAVAERRLVADGEIGEPADQLPRGAGVDEGSMPGPIALQPGSLLDKIRGMFGKR